MRIEARQRWLVLVVLLTLTLTAAAWVRDAHDPVADDAVVQAPERREQTARLPATPPVERVALEKLRGTGLDPGSGNAFAPRSWQAPAASKRAVVATEPAPPPPPPSVPPLPFTYLGRLASDEENAVFLTLGERNLIVHQGDVVDSTYRIDALADTQVTLTHLPSGIQQSLAIGPAP
jgi:hypothetical protein